MTQRTTHTKETFSQAAKDFEQFLPVKVERALKDGFQDYIGKYFCDKKCNKELNSSAWSCIIYPQKKSYKFVRTS